MDDLKHSLEELKFSIPRWVIIAIAIILLGMALSFADSTYLAYGECQTYLNAENISVTVCAPPYPTINETINLNYSESYSNSALNLVVIAPPLNNCTSIQNITVLNVTNVTYVNNITVNNVTNVTTESCQMLNKSMNLTYSQLYYDSARNLTLRAPDEPSCPVLSSYDVNIGYNETKSWSNVDTITIHGPSGNCTSSNVSVSQYLGYSQIFKVDQPGCFVELFSPPLQNMTCPEIPACPACPACPVLPAQICPKAICPNNTVTKEVNVDTCPKPNPSFNCTTARLVGDKMYCEDSLDSWCSYLVNNSISSANTQISQLTQSVAEKQGALDYINSFTGPFIAVIAIIICSLIGFVAYFVYNKLNVAGTPIAEGRQMLPPITRESFKLNDDGKDKLEEDSKSKKEAL